MENRKDSNVSVQDVKNTDKRKIIGANIEALKKRDHLTAIEFYNKIFPDRKNKPSTRKNKITDLVHGRKITIDDLVDISENTGTPFLELFTGIDEKNRDTAPTAYDVCKAFMHMLTSGLLNIEGTSKLREKGNVIKPLEQEKRELDEYYKDIPCRDSDEPDIPGIIDYPNPIYIRIMPRYFLKGDNVIEYKETDEIFTFIRNILEIYDSNLQKDSKIRYTGSELKSVNKSNSKNDSFKVGESYSDIPVVRKPDYHEPW